MSIAGAAAAAMAATVSKLPSPLPAAVVVKPVSMTLILGLFTLALMGSVTADEELSNIWETPPALETFTSYEDMQRYFDHRNQRRLRHIENPLKDSYIEAYNQHNEQEEDLRTKRSTSQQSANKTLPPAFIKFEVSDAVEPSDEVKQLVRQYKSRELQQNKKYLETIPPSNVKNLDLPNKPIVKRTPSNVISKQNVFGKRLNRPKRSLSHQQQHVNFKVKFIPFEVTDAREPDDQTKRLIKRMRALELERLAKDLPLSSTNNRNSSAVKAVILNTTTSTTKKPFTKRPKLTKQWKPKRIRREAAAPEMIKFEISDAKDPDPSLKTFMNAKRESKDLKLESKSEKKSTKPADADTSEQNSQASKRYFVFKEAPTKVKKSIAAIPHDVQNIISHLIKGGGAEGGGGKAYLKYIPAQQMDYNNLKAAYPLAKGSAGLYGHGGGGGGGVGYGHGGAVGGGGYGKYAHAVPVKFVYHPVVVGAVGAHGGGYEGGGGGAEGGGHGGAVAAVPVKYVAVGGGEAGYGGGGGGGEGGHGGGYGAGEGGGYEDAAVAAKYVAAIAAGGGHGGGYGGGGGGYEGGGGAGHAVAYAAGEGGGGGGGGKGGEGAVYVAAAAAEEGYAAGGGGGGHSGGYAAAGGHGVVYGLAHGNGLGAHANYAGGGFGGGEGEGHAVGGGGGHYGGDGHYGGGGGYVAAHAPAAIVHPIVVAEGGGGGGAKAAAYGAGYAEAGAAENAGNEAIKAIPAPQFKGEVKYSVVPTVEQYAKTATQDFQLKLYSPESLIAKAQLIAKDQAKAIAEQGQKAVAAAYKLAAGKGAGIYGAEKGGYGGGGGKGAAGFDGAEGGFGFKIGGDGLGGGGKGGAGYGGAEVGFGYKIGGEGLGGGGYGGGEGGGGYGGGKGGGGYGGGEGGGGYGGGGHGGGGGAGPVIKIEYHAPAESFKGNYKEIPEFQQLSALVGKSPQDQIHGLTYLLAKEMQNRLHLQRQQNYGGGGGGLGKGAAGKGVIYGGGGAEEAIEARPQDNKAPVLFQPQEAGALDEALAVEGGKGGGGGGGGGYYQPIVGKYLGMAKSKPYIPVIEQAAGEDFKGSGSAGAAKGGGGGGGGGGGKLAGSAYGLSPNYKGLGGLKGYGAGAGAKAAGGGENYNANAYEEAAAKLQSYASKYAFGYRIRDFNTGNDFGHKQNRDLHGVTRGQYHILLPDGRIQNVIYHADDTGFHADVSFESGRR